MTLSITSLTSKKAYMSVGGRKGWYRAALRNYNCDEGLQEVLEAMHHSSKSVVLNAGEIESHYKLP